MDLDPAETLRILMELKNHYGTLNRALVGEYLRKNGSTSARQIGLDVGVSTGTVIRALQDRSVSIHQEE